MSELFIGWFRPEFYSEIQWRTKRAETHIALSGARLAVFVQASEVRDRLGDAYDRFVDEENRRFRSAGPYPGSRRTYKITVRRLA